MQGTCSRRRAASGGSSVNSRISLCCNGHLQSMTPRIDHPRTAHHVTAAAPGTLTDALLPGAEHAGAAQGDAWTTVPTRAQILRDVANLCTFCGAILATLAMACMWKGRYVLRSSSSFLLLSLIDWQRLGPNNSQSCGAKWLSG